MGEIKAFRAAQPGGNPRLGQSFNDLVAALERALLKSERATLEKNARCRDLDTGILREHDVLITWNEGHHVIRTAIECRDRSRPVGVPDVEAFANKCARTGVDHKVIVSSTGFRASARSKAAASGISLFELQEATEFDWCEMRHWIEDRREFVGFEATIFFVDDVVPSEPFTLFDTEGREVGPDALQTTLTNGVPLKPEEERVVDIFVPSNVHAKTIEWTARDCRGAEYYVSHIEARGGYTVRRTLVPVSLHKYRGPQPSYDIASARLDLGGAEGKIMMVNSEKGTDILWVRDR